MLNWCVLKAEITDLVNNYYLCTNSAFLNFSLGEFCINLYVVKWLVKQKSTFNLFLKGCKLFTFITKKINTVFIFRRICIMAGITLPQCNKVAIYFF